MLHIIIYINFIINVDIINIGTVNEELCHHQCSVADYLEVRY